MPSAIGAFLGRNHEPIPSSRAGRNGMGTPADAAAAAAAALLPKRWSLGSLGAVMVYVETKMH